jgi:hypothetical protein
VKNNDNGISREKKSRKWEKDNFVAALVFVLKYLLDVGKARTATREQEQDTRGARGALTNRLSTLSTKIHQ